MNPSVRDRLGSVVRALNGVVLPALPKEASLAQEQVMLAMGHIQIILAQMDAAPDFLAEEAKDLTLMGQEVATLAKGGAETATTVQSLSALLAGDTHTRPEESATEIQKSLDAVLIALSTDGDPSSYQDVKKCILENGAVRAEKDRRWFAAMGFDIDYSGG